MDRAEEHACPLLSSLFAVVPLGNVAVTDRHDVCVIKGTELITGTPAYSGNGYSDTLWIQ